MQQGLTAPPYRQQLPVILAAAVAQGWALYGLHHSIAGHLWPATDPAWLFALYSVVVLIPVTIQLLAEHVRSFSTWINIGLMALMLFYFGWHHGSDVADHNDQNFARSGECFALAVVLTVLWLLTMPFLQARLESRRWSADYPALFAYSWRNVIGLTEAFVFTGLFWLILLLWKSLFHMLGINFFAELFVEPIFVYPVTSIVFGCALHLIGSIDRFVTTVLEQILSVFKWLGTVAGTLLAFFTIALVFHLPHLLFAGEKAIGTAWLLWLIAVVVLFLNAAYRDGAAERPYPPSVALALRLIIPLTVVISLTAIYALAVRAHHYGLTVERVWAFIVAGAALIYSVGYSFAALRPDPWFGGIARVNVVVAVALIAILTLTLTPLLSPYRLSAASQFNLILSGRFGSNLNSYISRTPFVYLRFDAGAYGRNKLAELSKLQNHPDEQRIRELSAAAEKLTNPWQAASSVNASKSLAALQIFPQGHSVDPDLSQKLLSEMAGPIFCGAPVPECAGLFVDLNADGIEEFVLLNAQSGRVYQKDSSGWRFVKSLSGKNDATWKKLLPELSNGSVSTKDPAWKELWIGPQRFQVQ